MPHWLTQIAFVVACLTIPIAWGWLVNLLFVRWSVRRQGLTTRRVAATDSDEHDSPFSDYQI